MRLKTTRKILKSFLTYPQVKFTYPMTGITNNEKSLIVFIDMEKLGEEKFEDFAISKTDTLLNIIDTIEKSGDVEIDLNNETDIIIKNNKITQKIRKSPLNLFQDVNSKSIDVVRQTADKIIDCEVKGSELRDIIGISRMLGNDTMILKDNKIITGKSFNKTLENENEYILDNGTFEDDIRLSLEYISKLPILDYRIEGFKIEKEGMVVKLVFLTPLEIDGVLVVISEMIV